MRVGANRIEYLIAIIASLGGAAAFAVYIESKKTRALTEEVLALDKEIKALELEKLRTNMNTLP